MNKNKGIIGIGLILAIVLGIVVIGGGVYYLGKSGSKQEVKTPENILPNNQNQNLQPVNQQVINNQQINPSITVLSPNGGEVYKTGGKINIKWNSKNIDSNKKISINVNKVIVNQDQAAEDTHNIMTTNSGSYEWLISKDMPVGQYEVYVTYLYGNVDSAYDRSDNLITINSATTTSVIAGCTPSSTPSITVLSPNGGEVFKAGDKITIKWSSCNLAKSTPIQIILQGNFSGGPWGTSPMANFALSPISVDSNSILNSGSATFTLPTKASTQWTGYSTTMKYGNYYKVYVSQNLADYIDVSDMSDNSFTINDPSISTTLPQYIGTHSDCGGPSQCWPPVITTSSQSYSCNNIGVAPNTEGNDVTAQRVINGKTYCIHSLSDGYAGGRGYTYTYTTSNGNGTKTTTFGLTYQSCGVYGGPTDPTVIQCQSNQYTFTTNLDNIIDSLMFN